MQGRAEERQESRAGDAANPVLGRIGEPAESTNCRGAHKVPAMRPTLALLLLLAAVAGTGIACGPTINESRLAFVPSRGDTCELDFVQATGADMSPGGKWRVIGYITIGGLGKTDPFAPENRNIVRPRACRMGATSVAIAVTSTTETMINSGSTVAYAALRPADEPAAAAPSKF